ncbi:MAG: GTP-binding protein [Candidatus Heimdallarchaeota archaeon]|nr:GTP-binding protein [Candidatus Heimdallarchaeota archaeon]
MFKRKEKVPTVRINRSDDGIENYFLKIALLGDGAVGKTNLRRRYLGQVFTTDHLMTLGADFAAAEKNIEMNDKTFHITFQVWDLAGQENFNQVRSMYYRGCFGALMVFDRTRPASFRNIPNWIAELKKNSGKDLIPIILLGNKFDLVDTAKNIVPKEDIDKFLSDINEEALKKGFEVKYLDTSALTGLNVEVAFETLGKSILTWLKV